MVGNRDDIYDKCAVKIRAPERLLGRVTLKTNFNIYARNLYSLNCTFGVERRRYSQLARVTLAWRTPPTCMHRYSDCKNNKRVKCVTREGLCYEALDI